jgi:hypothetical protein
LSACEEFQIELAQSRRVADHVDGDDPPLEDFEGLCFNNMILAFDRYYVHRFRTVG